MAAFTDNQLKNIQGLGIAGYRKDYQHLLFVNAGDQGAGRRLLAWLEPRVATAWEVGRFNQLFSEIRGRSNSEPLSATWFGVAVSAAGFNVLGVSLAGLPPREGSAAFAAGMARRTTQIGDTRPADEPASWLEPFRPGGGVHLLILIASDEEQDLNDAVTETIDHVYASGSNLVFEERGGTLPGALRGHEHFGFRDGSSQPAIADYDDPPVNAEPPPVPPGEFVLGYPDATGTVAAVGPLWADGSFGVFRRLTQDVAGFRHQAQAGVAGSDPAVIGDQLAAKMIGRWPDGASVELYPDADPGPDHESNAFQYHVSDDDGQHCPRWAHIRKANPRDETTPDPAGDAPGLHRMIRRGIPFGPPLPLDATGDDGVPRGLHFLCVVSDLDRQFEFVQRRWLNDPNFPGGQATQSQTPYAPSPQGQPDGPDPVIGEHDDGAECALHQASGVHQFPIVTEVVHVTAGEYFFLPSLSAVAALASGAIS